MIPLTEVQKYEAWLAGVLERDEAQAERAVDPETSDFLRGKIEARKADLEYLQVVLLGRSPAREMNSMKQTQRIHVFASDPRERNRVG